MKIRITDQILEIDEKTLYDWIKLGRVPLDAFVWSETLTNGQWQSVRELEPVRKLWGLDSDSSDTGVNKSGRTESESKVERRFLAYQKRPPVATLTLVALNLIVFLFLDQFEGRSRDQRTLIQFGAYSYHLIVEAGEYWRLITNTFLHVGELHLILNMGVLFIIGRLLEGLYGRWRFLILYLIPAINGSLASLYFVHHDAVGAGASGAIFGLVGVAVALGVRYKDRLPQRQRRIFGLRLLPFIGIDILLGVVFTQINNAAHLGGLFTGFVGALVLAPEIYTQREHETKIVAGLATALVGLAIASGVMTALHTFTNSAETVERRTDTVSPADLPDYIARYEKEILQRRYDPRSYAVLERLYIEALKNFPDDPSWTRKLKQFYEKALQADPDNSVWNNNLFWVYQETAFERPDEEAEVTDYIELCEKVAGKQGYHQPLYLNLEYFYTRAKRLAPQESGFWDGKLEAFYQGAVKKDPENGTWNNNLAWLYVEQQTKPQKTVELALNAVKQGPKEKNFLDTLGWAYLRDGQYRKALRAFEQVVGSPAETEDDLRAQESGWHGVTELVQAEKPAQESRRFNPAFLKFYDRLSGIFGEDSEDRAKLNTAFGLFQEGPHGG